MDWNLALRGTVLEPPSLGSAKVEGWDAGFGDDVLSGQACDLLAPCACESDDQRQPVERILDQDITGLRAPTCAQAATLNRDCEDALQVIAAE